MPGGSYSGPLFLGSALRVEPRRGNAQREQRWAFFLGSALRVPHC